MGYVKMQGNLRTRIITALVLLLIAPCVLAGGIPGGVRVGGTRIVFDERDPIRTIPITLDPAGTPMLIQSWVTDSRGRETKVFTVTPPLFRLDGGTNIVRIIKLDASQLSASQETLFYLNIRAIPGQTRHQDDEAGPDNGTNAIIFTVTRQMKLIYRPAVLGNAGHEIGQSDVAAAFSARCQVTLTNRSPYFVTLHAATMAGIDLLAKVPLEQATLAPYSQRTYRLLGKAQQTLTITTLNDFGVENSPTTLTVGGNPDATTCPPAG